MKNKWPYILVKRLAIQREVQIQLFLEKEREILTFHWTNLHNVTNLYRLPPDKWFISFMTAFEVLPTIKATKLFLLITWVNADYVSMLFMALWEDTKTVKCMEVSTWGLQLIQFDFDLRQSFLLRKDMDLIYSVYYFTSVFSTSIVSERWPSRRCGKYFHFSHAKRTWNTHAFIQLFTHAL